MMIRETNFKAVDACNYDIAFGDCEDKVLRNTDEFECVMYLINMNTYVLGYVEYDFNYLMEAISSVLQKELIPKEPIPKETIPKETSGMLSEEFVLRLVEVISK